MTAYVDSSVLLRLVLRQAGALQEWTAIRQAVASALVEVECLRTLDRVRLRAGVSDPDIALRRAAVFRLLESVHVVQPTRTILARAAQPLPTELGTLDAIHLATPTSWREATGAELIMATHDAALGLAARASGVRAVGVA